jgi:hypothetical protein
MGLYLARRMANDLVIEMTATSGRATSTQTTSGQAAAEPTTPKQPTGLTITLRFPTTRQQTHQEKHRDN